MKSLPLNWKNSVLELWDMGFAAAKLPIRSLVRSFRRVRGLTNAGPAEVIKRKLHSRSSVFFVQVGSNDGLNGDPLHKLIKSDPRWKGIFIEPVRYAFDRLRLNYDGEDRFVYENVAISDLSG